MSIYKVTAFVCFVILFKLTHEKCADDDKGCVQTKTHGMISADCYNGNFRKIPQCLRSDVEILDVSFNRIRKITKDEIGKYKRVKILYLSDNLLTNLDDSTFEDLGDLITLDLSLNAIVQPPPTLFRLPSLKRLYLSQNQNINIIDMIEQAKPISSPLELLDVSFDELKTLPDLGLLPYLLLYNISGNHLLNLKVSDIAGVCNLKVLANANFSASFQNPCDCWNFQQWLRNRDVAFTQIPCQITQESCPYNISQEDLKTFNDCKSRQEVDRKATLFVIGISAAAVIAVLALVIIGYIIYRRKRNRKFLRKKQSNILLDEKKETAGFL
uniref:LRRCT domain-containing protein n=1 Tax=Photinus pyralis TaxID=7054 RepID=A0A1Y1MJK5_PHOPY